MARFLALYATLFAAFGVASPFFAAYLAQKGLTPQAIGVVLAAGTATRLAAGPLGGRIADQLGRPRLILTVCTAAAAVIAMLYLPAAGLLALMLVSMTHAATLAPIVPLADALTLAAATTRRFAYGWIRGTGSAAFIAGTILSGQAVARFGLPTIITLNAALLGTAAIAAALVPDYLRTPIRQAAAPGIRTLPGRFWLLMAVAALIQGSHAFHDAFVVINWRHHGIPAPTISLLWSESVAGEVIVFFLIGRPLIDRLTPAGASILSAVAGIIRWATLAQTASITAAALVEPLHGFTFALQHLACMRLIAAIVPSRLAATAQAIYGTVAVGIASTLLTLASGPLYAAVQAQGFWVMAALCAAAIPLAARLR